MLYSLVGLAIGLYIGYFTCIIMHKKEPSKPISIKVRKKTLETAETRKINDILANINAYDGTNLGQKEIKHG